MRTAYLSLCLLLAAGAAVPEVSVGQLSQLNTYGWFDVRYDQSTTDGPYKNGRFDQNHLNLILLYQLGDNMLVLAEPEFEHGFDFRGGVGQLYLQRAYAEYRVSDALKVRAGKFLSPITYWNVNIDATPLYLPVFLPSSVYGKNFNSDYGYAKFTAGVWLNGSHFAGSSRFEYDLYLGNGRGAQPYSDDENPNKSVGARLAAYPVEGLRLAVSAYAEDTGTRSDARMRAFGVEALYQKGRLVAQAEALFPRHERLEVTAAAEGEGGESVAVPDGTFHDALGGYALLGYEIGRVTPFVVGGIFDGDLAAGGDRRREFTFGLNYAFAPRVRLKGQVQRVLYEEALLKPAYTMLSTQVAVAF